MGFVCKLRGDASLRTFCLTLLSGLCLLASIISWFPQLPFDPAWVTILISGIPIVWGAVKGLVTEFDVTADVLVAMALVASVAIGEYFAAGEVAFIMQLGKVLEDVTAGKTKQNLEALIRMTPQKAILRTPDGEQEILASQVKIGDLLLVRPGESIPADGRILRGSTSIDQSLMTGESVPVDKATGDAVYQGTVNQQGAFELEVIRDGEDSSLQQMIRLVAMAEENKAPIVRLSDKWARILVPVALGLSLLIFLLTGDVRRAVTALVVFCPCALILATPTAMMAAVGNATKNGILIKSGAAIEAAAAVDTLVLDKTGTLTNGKLRVCDVIPFQAAISLKSLLRYAAGAEKFSEHPIGRAVAAYGREQGVDVPDPEAFDMEAGKGIVARVDGHEVRIGEKALECGAMKNSPEAVHLADILHAQGKTVLPVTVDGKIAGFLSLQDVLRKEARGTVDGLKKIGINRVLLLTGDHQVVADAIGREAGVEEVLASMLPGDKVNAVLSLMKAGNMVAMVGDGVNDAPALASASVGIAMGTMGSAVAMEAADIALLGDDLSKLPYLMRLCRKTKKRILFNIAVSMMINFSAIALAGIGVLNPASAAIVHNTGSVFVVVSSALLLGYRE